MKKHVLERESALEREGVCVLVDAVSGRPEKNHMVFGYAVFRRFLASGVAQVVTGGLIVLLLAATTLVAGGIAALRTDIQDIAPILGQGTCFHGGADFGFADGGAAAAWAAIGVRASHGRKDRGFFSKNSFLLVLAKGWWLLSGGAFWGKGCPTGPNDTGFWHKPRHRNISALADTASAGSFIGTFAFSGQYLDLPIFISGRRVPETLVETADAQNFQASMLPEASGCNFLLFLVHRRHPTITTSPPRRPQLPQQARPSTQPASLLTFGSRSARPSLPVQTRRPKAPKCFASMMLTSA
jgi:hypothetical protein